MSEARWRQELEASKAEIAELRDRLAMAMPSVYKGLSLFSIVPKWSVAETAAPLEEYLSSTGAVMKGQWDGA